MHPELSRAWFEARGKSALIHLDSAACSRTSIATRTAMSAHLELEATEGGYIAEALVADQLETCRAGLASLTGFATEDVSFAHSAGDAMAQLLLALAPASVGTLTSDYQRTAGTINYLGCKRSWLPVEGTGRIDLEALPAWLVRERPDVVLLCAVASHLGIAQPVLQATELCRAADVPVIVDAAQALGLIDLSQLRCAALVSTSRKWLAGPRGVGFIAIRPGVLDLQVTPPWIRPEEWISGVHQHRCEPPEASIAGRVGLALAVSEFVAAGPAAIRERLAWIGRQSREILDGVQGWTVVEPRDEPTAITTLRPPPGIDVAATRARLITDHGILTTYLGPERALADADRLPALRMSPHVDAITAELETLARAL